MTLRYVVWRCPVLRSMSDTVFTWFVITFPLTAAELKIMATLIAAPGRVFSKAQLYSCINGEPYAGSENSVMVHISNIRGKLEDDPLHPRYIKTVRGLGYRLDG